MSTPLSRLELTLDIVGLPAQRAFVLPDLMPVDLIGHVLAEFGELEHLGSAVADYELVSSKGDALDVSRPLGSQLTAGAHLRLRERLVMPPAGATQPHHALYLRDRATSQVFRLPWVPALIGRADAKLPDNDLLAVDLGAHDAGQRVSRRQARLIESRGAYLLERLSPNPIAINDAAGCTTAVEDTPVPIQHGDTLVCIRSQIALTFIVRDKEPVEAE